MKIFLTGLLSFSLFFAHTIQLEEEEEKEDTFDLNISVTNPEKVGKSLLYNSSWPTSKEVILARVYFISVYCNGKWVICMVKTVRIVSCL